MHHNAKDLTGLKFGKLTAIKPNGERIRGRVVWECHCDCGNFVSVPSKRLLNGNTQSCGCLFIEVMKDRMGAKNPNWKGGRQIRFGYAFIIKHGHPGADCWGYVQEHRLVMEKKIGRYLNPGETVHHLDGNKLNNAPDNLNLFPSTADHSAYHRKLERISEYD